MFDGADILPDEAAALDALSSAAALIEDRVVAIGESLDAALGILERQTTTFDALTDELGGQDATVAAEKLRRAIVKIDEAAREHAHARVTLTALENQVRLLAGRASAMRLLVKHAMTLALYLRLETARIAGHGSDFVDFAEGVKRATEQMHAELTEFAAEIEVGATLVGAAARDHAAFDGNHGASLAGAAARLDANLSALHAQRGHVQACGGEVAGRSRDMRQQVCQAVQALQIGDTTRQRLEHAHAALVLLIASGAGGRREAGHQIVADQMADTAAAFAREAGSIASAFQAMADDARGIAELGDSARDRLARPAQTEIGQTGLLACVKTDVEQVLATLGAIEVARQLSGAALAMVLGSIVVLRQRVGAIRTMQSNLHLMGLNITLKCGRLGQVGVSIGAIAEDMRGCSRHMAEETANVVAELAELSRIAGQSAASGPGDEQAAVEENIDAPEALIEAALAKLSLIDERVNAALAALALDGETVMGMLQGGASAIAVQVEITRLTDRATAALPPIAPEPAVASDQGHTATLKRMFALYTMAREREIHRIALGITSVDEDRSEPSKGGIDDLLF